MAELSINADQIAEALRKHVGGFSTTLEKARVGRVLEVGDGIARVSGLPETAVNELLEFEGGTLGLALNLDEDSIGAVVLGEAEEVEEGHTVQETGRILSVPVGDGMRGQGVKCIYVAVGQKGSTVAQTVATLESHGAMEYTVVVNAPAADPAVFKYLAPYAGCAIGQYWMDNGDAGLVVYDDLSKQAESYRQLSLLLRRPPGREAYPGDVFYLHSRLLERAAKLSEERGSG